MITQLSSAPLGFLNPLLYKMAGAGGCKGCFQDIVTGDNKCTEVCQILTYHFDPSPKLASE